MLRTYGRTPPDKITGKRQWIEVTSGATGDDSYVWATTLCQVLAGNLGEAPFFADWGLPAHQSVVTQVQPDYYIVLTQRRFAARFASLIVAKTQQYPSPIYSVKAVTKYGTVYQAQVAQ